MSAIHRSRTPAPVIRHCALCGQPKAILPDTEEHRKAHLTKQIAFVCPDCAEAVRQQVAAAGETVEQPKASA